MFNHPIFAIMLSVEHITVLIEEHISTLEIPKQPAGLYDPARYILAEGGKRIRPCLALLSANIFSDSIDSCLDVAVAMEVFHNFTLVHDDIMDNAPKRRGIPTIHEKWNVSTGILSGDALLIIAYQLLSKAPKERLQEILKMFNATALKVCEGQQMDMDFETKITVELSEYIDMITGKTAVLLGCSLYCGALSANAKSADAELLYQAGIQMGNCFQIQDDLLDAFGDNEKFGKKTGGDIIQNKKTYLYLRLLEKAETEDKNLLIDLFSKPTENEAIKIETVLNLYKKYTIEKDARTFMQILHDEAMDNISKIPVEAERKDVLKGFLDYVFNRNY